MMVLPQYIIDQQAVRELCAEIESLPLPKGSNETIRQRKEVGGVRSVEEGLSSET
jgi:hypothetical protein